MKFVAAFFLVLTLAGCAGRSGAPDTEALEWEFWVDGVRRIHFAPYSLPCKVTFAVHAFDRDSSIFRIHDAIWVHPEFLVAPTGKGQLHVTGKLNFYNDIDIRMHDGLDISGTPARSVDIAPAFVSKGKNFSAISVTEGMEFRVRAVSMATFTNSGAQLRAVKRDMWKVARFR